jgi:hypothetical protein
VVVQAEMIPVVHHQVEATRQAEVVPQAEVARQAAAAHRQAEVAHRQVVRQPVHHLDRMTL